jgi:hypothetical protein
MAEVLSTLSPLGAPACAVRLQRLAAEPAFLVVHNGKETKVAISELRVGLLEGGSYRVSFTADCERVDVLRALGLKLSYALEGRLAQSSAGALLRIHARPAWPTLATMGLLPMLGAVGWAGLLIGLVAEVVQIGDSRLWQIAGGAALVLSLFYGMLFLFYNQAMSSLDALLRKTLGAPSGDVTVRALPIPDAADSDLGS